MIKILATIGGIEQTFDFAGTSDELISRLGAWGISVHQADATKPIDELFLAMTDTPAAAHHLNSLRTAVVSNDVFWKPINANTPRGASMCNF